MASRHLLSTADLSADDATLILDTAEGTGADPTGRAVKKLPTLRGLTVVNLFYEDSTRTRVSFETAAKRLSADVINFTAKGSSVSKGESLKDTAQTLRDGGGRRRRAAWASGAACRLADAGWIDAVVNAGDGRTNIPRRRCSTRSRCGRGWVR